MEFSDRPRSVRDYLNDTSVKALCCANEARTGMRGEASAAAGARVCSAVLAEIRDALDLLAPWLTDRPQVTHALQLAVKAAEPSGFQVEVPPIDLAEMVGASVEYGIAKARVAREAREAAAEEGAQTAPESEPPAST